MNVKIISAILALALIPLASMACGFSVDLPQMPKTGPTVTDEIMVADPKSDETRLSLMFGAGELILSPGAEGFVEGTAAYNLDDLKPEVTSKDGAVQIKQGGIEKYAPFNELENTWDFKLGNMPVDLSIEAGAYKGRFDLGGLSLSSLTIKDGAADVELSFSEPNATEMSILRYETGASNVKLSGLANANFTSLIFNSGAGDYTLDFSGELQRDATVNLSSGLSNVILIIPEGVNAEVTVEGGFKNVSAGPGWSQSGDVYTQEGDGPTLTFVIEMGAGNLTLTK